MVEGIEVVGAESLGEVAAMLDGRCEIVPAERGATVGADTAAAAGRFAEDFADVRGRLRSSGRWRSLRRAATT